MLASRIRGPRCLALVAVVLAIAASLVVAGSHVLHVHAADTAGFYNEQHVLQAVAGLTADVPVPSAPPASAAPLVVAASPAALRPVASAPAVRRADPRAPPSA